MSREFLGQARTVYPLIYNNKHHYILKVKERKTFLGSYIKGFQDKFNCAEKPLHIAL